MALTKMSKQATDIDKDGDLTHGTKTDQKPNAGGRKALQTQIQIEKGIVGRHTDLPKENNGEQNRDLRPVDRQA